MGWGRVGSGRVGWDLIFEYKTNEKQLTKIFISREVLLFNAVHVRNKSFQALTFLQWRERKEKSTNAQVSDSFIVSVEVLFSFYVNK